MLAILISMPMISPFSSQSFKVAVYRSSRSLQKALDSLIRLRNWGEMQKIGTELDQTKNEALSTLDQLE